MGRDEKGIQACNKFGEHILSMIFVTVGTHEQPFNRLIREIDRIKAQGLTDERVIVQSGYSTYEPKYCESHEFLSYNQMQELMEEAHIIITHGGPSTFMQALQHGKIPIVVPRMSEYHEHVNDHQVTFSREVSLKMRNIILVDDVAKLWSIISRYDDLVKTMDDGEGGSHNAEFNLNLQKIIRNLMDGNSSRK